LIEATGGGVLYEPRNVEALAEAIESLVINPEKRRALGEAGRKAVRQNFSAGLMAENIVRAFQQMPSGRPAHQETGAAFQIANRDAPT
jgi:glycosyltransferase involved in cell wall biosynthesis